MANVVITGANRGIGLELAKLFAARGDAVTGICRDTSDELEDIADQVISGIDLTADESLGAIATILEQLLEGPLDVLINNAGLFTNETINSMDFDAIQRQFDINAMVPLKLTMMLLPYMAEGSKIANITSRMGSIADNTSGSYYGYRASKAALNAFGKSLAMDLKPQGIAVAQLHPGFVKTRMVGFNGDITPEEAAQGLAARIDELTLENSGGFWHSNGQELPW
ncbi:MAG: short-chain dehydrogenase [Oceanospirillaceae bacterium]|uniref:SDR family oxidoreductase n=1 Tax=unclassified Thalassolituus TaxID=2624967 RepID=UPI000C0B1C87|nr:MULTISPECIES: SDR family oxidoreductase [unclassified Thalassolituus]MAK92112.1 short-chain dehydrogenase [Thalassolituus sp.]MAX99435.1 short-chain dehydrogenase [Oceanospirillaceae bacterium]MBL36438.1 short-chain dehydrogenase [Oceanospirillaceae bacterium]MBS54673.1 short-chain dehydrogenase [Oceanospirillaceae bacterium]|tara:strand:- start:247 stop:918 length:672 start_codon:yes stop_codon:yes gene_type:complete